jgi:MFS family permease
MCFFIGWTLSSNFLSAWSDKNGRKLISVIAWLNNMISMIIILLLPGKDKIYYYIICAVYFSAGVTTGARVTASYCYMIELVPPEWAPFSCTFWNCMEGLVYIYLTIYYRFINKNWEWTFICGIIIQGTACLF